jgi:hypothetical protein
MSRVWSGSDNCHHLPLYAAALAAVSAMGRSDHRTSSDGVPFGGSGGAYSKAFERAPF